MPNWCYTKYIFHGSEKHLTTFREKIHEWTSTEFMNSYFGTKWLGNIVIGAGFKDRIDNSNESMRIRCRGSLLELGEVEDTSLSLSTETAWVPMPYMWQLIINKLGLHIHFSYFAEEPGMELYEIYDPKNEDFANMDYFINGYLEGVDKNIPYLKWIDEYCECSREVLLQLLQKTLHTNSTDITELIIRMQCFEFGGDSYIRITPICRISAWYS